MTMDILITRHLTLRPLLEVDADDIRDLIAKEPILAAKLPRAMVALIGSDDLSDEGFEPSGQSLVVIREKLIGWVSLHEANATAFSSGREGLAAEALAAALQYFVRHEITSSTSVQQHSSQFAA
jgi:hypothetical protein